MWLETVHFLSTSYMLLLIQRSHIALLHYIWPCNICTCRSSSFLSLSLSPPSFPARLLPPHPKPEMQLAVVIMEYSVYLFNPLIHNSICTMAAQSWMQHLDVFFFFKQWCCQNDANYQTRRLNTNGTIVIFLLDSYLWGV